MQKDPIRYCHHVRVHFAKEGSWTIVNSIRRTKIHIKNICTKNPTLKNRISLDCNFFRLEVMKFSFHSWEIRYSCLMKWNVLKLAIVFWNMKNWQILKHSGWVISSSINLLFPDNIFRRWEVLEMLNFTASFLIWPFWDERQSNSTPKSWPRNCTH